MKLLICSDVSSIGSGYGAISVGIAKEMVRRGHQVWLVGSGYQGSEHDYPFSLIGVNGPDVSSQMFGYIHNMQALKYDNLLIALDIPAIDVLLPSLGRYGIDASGLFPLESTPLTRRHAMPVMSLKRRFVISKFGTEELEKKGIEAHFVPIPVDRDCWVVPTPEQKQDVRDALGLKGKVVLTVAENQERKNLAATAEIIAKVPECTWVLVTALKRRQGWDIEEYTQRLGISERCLLIEKGVPFKRLWMLYAASDAFLLTSKAEGLGMPVLEAMSCGVPVVAPTHTAFLDHLSDGRGYLARNQWMHVDPFGNQNRWWVDTDDAAGMLKLALDPEIDHTEMRAKCDEYLALRSWERVGDILCQQLQA